MVRILLYVLAALVALIATVAVLAPAQWVVGPVAKATQGRITLAETSGTIWSGRGKVVLAAGSDRATGKTSLPGQLSWRLAPLPLVTGVVDLTLEHSTALAQPLSIRADSKRMQASAAQIRLPAIVLTGLGAPWNTIRPGGVVILSWDRLTMESGRVQGSMSAEWQFASSGLTPISPFGHYRLQTNGVYPGTRLNLLTLSGPLQLTGDGTIDEGGRLRFQGSARAMPNSDPTVKVQLAGFIALLGRRDGDAAVLNFGN